jgi:hypothetical protein
MQPRHRAKPQLWRAGLEIACLGQMQWQKDACHHFQVTASNRSFAGKVQIFDRVARIHDYADLLHGFLNSVSDTREVRLGELDLPSSFGGVQLRFFCKNSAGQATVEIYFDAQAEMDTHLKVERKAQSARFYGDFHAVDFDHFVRELRRLTGQTGESAWLRFQE